jgi:hypothetical protein
VSVRLREELSFPAKGSTIGWPGLRGGDCLPTLKLPSPMTNTLGRDGTTTRNCPWKLHASSREGLKSHLGFDAGGTGSAEKVLFDQRIKLK